MEIITVVTFILGMILGSVLIIVATYVYWKKQIFPVGAIIMTVFGTLLLGLSIWQSVKIQIGVDGNVTASFEKLKQEVKEVKKEVKQNDENFTEKIDILLDSTDKVKLKDREKVDKKIDTGDLEGAIKLDPANVIAYMRLIERLVNESNYSKAISYYDPLVSSNRSGVGYSAYPALIFAYDQTDNTTQANNLVQQLRLRVNDDINKGYGYYSRSQQIGWLKESLEKYVTSFKNEEIKKSVLTLINELNGFFKSI